MKNWCFILFIVFYLSSDSYSQVQPVWIHRYESGYNADDRASDITLDSKDNIYVGGKVYEAAGTIIKYRSDGQFIKSITIDNMYDAINIYVTKSDIVYFSGMGFAADYGWTVMKYDSSLNLIWRKTFSDGFISNPFNSIIDENENIYMTGSILVSGYVRLGLIKYDSSGNLKWSRYINNTPYSYGISLDMDSFKNIYVCGILRVNPPVSYNYQAVTVKYDSSGDEIWSRIYHSPFHVDSLLYMDTEGLKIKCDKQNNIILGTKTQDTTHDTHMSIIKYSSDGNLIWEKFIKGPQSVGDEIRDLKTDSNCSIYALNMTASIITWNDYMFTKFDSSGIIKLTKIHRSEGITIDNPESLYLDRLGNIYVTGDPVTVKYDSLGNEKWIFMNRYKNIKFSGVKIVTEGSNNLFVTGSGYSGSPIGNYDIFTVKLSQTVWIRNQNEFMPEKFILFQNYPNPFNPTTNIKYQITDNKFITIKIYDILGKEVSTLVNTKQQPGTYEVSFDARHGGSSSLSTGIYFYSLYVDGNRIDTKRFVLLK
jgi:hypothetical protein